MATAGRAGDERTKTMNLFWLDTDPVRAAQAHHDVHVRKMLLEGVQLLCTVFEEPLGILRVYGQLYQALSPRTSTTPAPAGLAPAAATSTQPSHCARPSPPSIATASTRSMPPRRRWRGSFVTAAQRDRPFALAMPEKYKVNLDEYTFVGTAAVMAYRAYYRAEKRGHWRSMGAHTGRQAWVPAKWTRRNPPEWFVL